MRLHSFTVELQVDAVVVYLLLCCSHCLLEFCVRSLFCDVVLCVLSSLAIILLRKRELVALTLTLLWPSSRCRELFAVYLLFFLSENIVHTVYIYGSDKCSAETHLGIRS